MEDHDAEVRVEGECDDGVVVLEAGHDDAGCLVGRHEDGRALGALVEVRGEAGIDKAGADLS